MTELADPSSTMGSGPYLAGYRFALPALRATRLEREWSLERLAGKLRAAQNSISRPTLGDVERHVSRAAPRLQAALAAVYGESVDDLFEDEDEQKLRRKEQEGEWVRMTVAARILGLTSKTGVIHLTRSGVLQRRGGPSHFQYHRPTLEALVPAGSLTLPQLVERFERSGLTLRQVHRYRRLGKLKAFQPWPGGAYRVRPEDVEEFERSHLAASAASAEREKKIERARKLRREGSSYEQIAAEIGVSYPTVREWALEILPARARPKEVGERIAAAKAPATKAWAAEVPRGGCGVPGCSNEDCPFDYGECHDGCDEQAPVADQSDRHRMYVRNEPKRYIAQHHLRTCEGQAALDHFAEAFSQKRKEESEEIARRKAEAGLLGRTEVALKLDVFSPKAIDYYSELGLLEEDERLHGAKLYRPETVEAFRLAWARGLDDAKRMAPLKLTTERARLSSRGLLGKDREADLESRVKRRRKSLLPRFHGRAKLLEVAEDGRHAKGKAAAEETARDGLTIVRQAPKAQPREQLLLLIRATEGRDAVLTENGERRTGRDPVFRAARTRTLRRLKRGYVLLGQPPELARLVS